MNEQLMDKNEYYCLGVSGGCDSMYLMEHMRLAGYRFCVAHVNYHYREDSDLDQELVEKYCHRYGIPCFVKECNPHEYHQGNFQEQARLIRYHFYKDVMKQHNCIAVVLGHHKDDVIETIVMKQLKHQLVYYLGMKDINKVYGINVIRPMLSLYKNDIRQYCDVYHVPYRDDYTNFETEFMRDKVRNITLKDLSEEEKERIYNDAREHNKRIENEEFKVKGYYLDYKNKGYLRYKDIQGINKEILFYLILKDLIDIEYISLALIDEIVKQMESSKPNISMDLPVNYVFIKEYDNIFILPKEDNCEYSYLVETREFICPFFTLSDQGHLNEGIYLNDYDFPLVIRSFKNGDKIKTQYGTKKVSRLFIDAKIPMAQRKVWPIVLNQLGEIVLIPNIAKNNDYLSIKPNVFVLK